MKYGIYTVSSHPPSDLLNRHDLLNQKNGGLAKSTILEGSNDGKIFHSFSCNSLLQ